MKQPRRLMLMVMAILAMFSLVATACGADDVVGDAVDSATDAVGDVAEGAGDAVGDAADAITGDDDDDADAEMAEEEMSDDDVDAEMAEEEMAEAEVFEVSYGIAEPVSIDSVNLQESEGFEVARLLFDGLTDLSSDLTAVPAVAESWESPDNTVWTFNLRDDVAFHNGEPVTAQSFVNAFNRVADPESLSDVAYYGSYIAGISGWADVEAGEATEVSGAVAIDDYTLEITLDTPYPLLPKAMAHPVFAPVSDETLAGANPEAPIGNGAYMMDGEWEHDIGIRVVRNDDYYGDPGIPDAINFEIFDSIETQYLEVQAGNLDVADVPPEKIAVAEDDFPGRFLQLDTGSYTYLGFPTQLAPFDNPDLRRALSLAIDRDAIADVIFDGTRAPANGFAPPLAPGATASCTNCTYDPEQALELYEAAGGIPDGAVNVYFNSGAGHEEWIEAVANNWKQTFDLDVTFVGQEWPQHIGLLDEGGQDGPYRLGWLWDLPSAENFLSPLFLEASDSNYASYSSADFEAAIAEFKAAPSEVDGFPALAKAQEILNEDMPVLPIVFGRAQKVYSENIDNVNYTVFGYTELENVQPAG